jgi:hypothetical protein
MGLKRRPTSWLRLDELSNAIDNLEMCRRFLASIRSEVRWKWAILAWHQALYGFAICAVRGTDDLSVLRNPKNHASKLISIDEAIDRCKASEFLWPGATPLVISKDEQKVLTRLIKEFRNGFEHFRAMSWSIETSGMPALFRVGLGVLRRIALDSGAVRYDDLRQKRRVSTALRRLDSLVRERAV